MSDEEKQKIQDFLSNLTEIEENKGLEGLSDLLKLIINRLDALENNL